MFLCSCRIDQEKSEEIFFLREANFRFTELHYTPELRDLQNRNFEAEDILVAEARLGDRERLAEIAGNIFEHGRFTGHPTHAQPDTQKMPRIQNAVQALLARFGINARISFNQNVTLQV